MSRWQIRLLAAGIAAGLVLRELLDYLRGSRGVLRWHARARLNAPPGSGDGLYAFYSSVTGRTTTDPSLMVLPIDDHAIVRGHAVFDTCTLRGGRLYRLDIHLERLLASAKAARIPLPAAWDAAHFADRIAAAVAASGRRDADVRFWLSAGPGNLGVTPAGCATSFYVLVFGGLPLPSSWARDGIAEATVPSSVVPLKPPLLAEMKSNNYLLNVLTAMAAQDAGGTLGIQVDDAGLLRESAVLNVVVIDADGVFRTPPFDGILRGTTVRRAMELAPGLRDEATGAPLVRKVAQGDVSLAAARKAKELMLVAGDTHVFPITTLDGAKIGTGRVGPVAAALLRALERDAEGD